MNFAYFSTWPTDTYKSTHLPATPADIQHNSFPSFLNDFLEKDHLDRLFCVQFTQTPLFLILPELLFFPLLFLSWIYSGVGFHEPK